MASRGEWGQRVFRLDIRVLGRVMLFACRVEGVCVASFGACYGFCVQVRGACSLGARVLDWVLGGLLEGGVVL